MVYQLKNAGVLRDMMAFEPETIYSVIEDVFLQRGISDVYGGDAEKELVDCTKTSTDEGMTLCMALGATEMSKTLHSMAVDDPPGSTRFAEKMGSILKRIDEEVDYVADRWYGKL